MKRPFANAPHRRSLWKPVFPLLCAWALLPAALFGAELSVQEAIDRAVEKNLGLRVQRYNPAVAREGVTLEESTFDIEVSGLANSSTRKRANVRSVTQASESDIRNYNLGASKRLSTGASLSLSTDLSRFGDNAPTTTSQLSYNTEIGLEIRQPLLQGYGRKINLAPIDRARSALSESKYRFRQQVMNVLEEAETAYWDLAFAYSRRALLGSALELSETLLAETQEKERVGLATQVQVLQAEADLALRRESIIVAEQNIANASDNLLSVMGSLSDERVLTEDTVEVTRLPEDRPPLPDIRESWESVLSWDLDLAIQNEVIRQRELDLLVARNRVEPRLDLTASAGYIGFDDQTAVNSIESALNGDGDFWSIGASFSMPWARRQNRARLRQSEFFLEREQARAADIRQQLLQAFRQRWRRLDTAGKRLDAAEVTLQLQRATYEQASARYEAGLIAFREILESQRDFDNARLSMLNARIEVIRAAVALARLDGSILDRNGFTMEELAERPEASVQRASHER